MKSDEIYSRVFFKFEVKNRKTVIHCRKFLVTDVKKCCSETIKLLFLNTLLVEISILLPVELFKVVGVENKIFLILLNVEMLLFLVKEYD